MQTVDVSPFNFVWLFIFSGHDFVLDPEIHNLLTNNNTITVPSFAGNELLNEGEETLSNEIEVRTWWRLVMAGNNWHCSGHYWGQDHHCGASRSCRTLRTTKIIGRNQGEANSNIQHWKWHFRRKEEKSVSTRIREEKEAVWQGLVWAFILY